MVKQGKGDVEIVPAPVFRFKPLQSQGREFRSVGADDSSTESDDGEGAAHPSMAVERAIPSKYEKAYEKTPVYEKAPGFVSDKRENRPPKSAAKKAKEATEVMEKAREVLRDATRSSSSQTRSLSPQDGSSGDLVDDAANVEEQPPEWEARRVMLKELAGFYRSELIGHCRELVTLQRQWKSELPVTVAVPVTVHPEAIAIVGAAKPVRVNVRKSKGKDSKGAKGGRGDDNLMVHSRGPVKLPIRRRIAWRANEREALRRGLLSFGLGRADKVRDVMASLLKELRHGIGDIADCCWEFLRCCAIHADAKEIVEYSHKRYAAHKELDLESGQELSERVGVFEKTDKSSTLWLRRLRLLDSLQEVIRLCSTKESRELAYRAIDSVKDASVPSEWWSRDADLALLYGIYKHGFGNYDLIRNDEEFRDAFRSKKSKKLGNGENTDSEDDLQTPLSGRHDMLSEAFWPDAQVLTRRLKRLVDHIIRSSQMPPKPAKGSASARSGEDTPWSKRERLELIKLLMRWGAPMLPGPVPKLNWQFFRDVTSSAPLRRRKDSSLEAGYQELMNDMRDYLEGPDGLDKTGAKRKNRAPKGPKGESSAGADEQPAKASVLTYKTAVRLKERLEILDTLRLGVESVRGDWAALGFTPHQHTHDLPRCEKDDSDDENTDEDHEREPKPRPAGAKLLGAGGPAPLNVPSPTACIKRLKFVANVLRRAFKKPKPKRKRPAPAPAPETVKEVELMRENVRGQKRPAPERDREREREGGESGRAPKRPKYVAPAPPPPPSPSPSPSPTAVEAEEESTEMEYDIERDEQGYPLLPLQLTETLTLVDLGSVDPDNPRVFHRDPFVYPLGYVAERDYPSMVNPSETTMYTCSILDGHDRPVFQVTPSDVPELTVQKESPQGVWTVVFAAVNRLSKDPHRDRHNPSGVEMFGLSHPVVVQLIQEQIVAGARDYRHYRQPPPQRAPELSSYRREPVTELEVPNSSRDKKKGKDKQQQQQSRSSGKKRQEETPPAPPPPPAASRRPVPHKVELDLNSDPDDEDTE
ncbi:hypothetical protein AXG93_4123s1110 [Marchantia polymorpha subsp. ruderalis]|uniref:ATP-dependent helicase CHD1-2/hrp3 HTH domain-containing protein n=1 Tax=Marchantia polymorpha subsp. ruderalis TaxID=1480154 RepID=A0A176WM61_MARPO|nr:hypothetical protein AXG93_4123s1110 [Marchantia polymorpha subsp. ruderalis]